MKKHGAVVAAALLFAASVVAQEKKVKRDDVPAPVLAAFAKAFPKAQAIGYSQEKEDGKTLYEVESKEGTVHRDVTFEPEGKLVVVEEEVAVKDLPQAVRAALQKEKGKCVLAEKLIRGTIVEYEMHMKDGKYQAEVLTDANGKVLKREAAGKD